MDEAWVASAMPPLEWLESIRTPVLDALFLFLTALGTEPFLLFFVALGYWLVHRRRFAVAAGMLVAAALLNTLLKGTFRIPRPDISRVTEAEGWSFPSGHAQMAFALWGWLAMEQWRAGRRGWALALVALAGGIAASRPYLGVHYVHDVVVGAGLGALQVGLASVLIEGARRNPPGRTSWAILAMTAVALLLAFDSSVRDSGVRLLGASVGLVGGAVLALRQGLGRVPTALSARVALTGVGVLGLMATWLGLKLVLRSAGLDASLALAFGRYALVGLWVSWAAPALIHATLSSERATASG